ELKEALKGKNPYLYKALGVEKADDIVKDILSAHISSSDEGIFGDAFFEPLAEKISKGRVADAEGADIIIEDDNLYKVIQVKSGPNAFNASSKQKQSDNFKSIERRVAKRKKVYNAMVGYGYGTRSTELNKYRFREVAGQAFWEELTNDPDFSVKIISAMRDRPKQHLIEYQKSFDTALDSFTKEFIDDFCFDDGTINWNKILKFNSGKVCKKLEVKPSTKTLDKGEVLKLDVVAVFSEDEQITNPDDTTYSSDEVGIVEIDKNGAIRVKDTAKPGSQAKITVRSFGGKKTITVKVKKAR